ncbi:hypothetical protein MTO96_045362 [Rhipicephalus appendiculatus]
MLDEGEDWRIAYEAGPPNAAHTDEPVRVEQEVGVADDALVPDAGTDDISLPPVTELDPPCGRAKTKKKRAARQAASTAMPQVFGQTCQPRRPFSQRHIPQKAMSRTLQRQQGYEK